MRPTNTHRICIITCIYISSPLIDLHVLWPIQLGLPAFSKWTNVNKRGCTSCQEYRPPVHGVVRQVRNILYTGLYGRPGIYCTRGCMAGQEYVVHGVVQARNILYTGLYRPGICCTRGCMAGQEYTVHRVVWKARSMLYTGLYRPGIYCTRDCTGQEHTVHGVVQARNILYTVLYRPGIYCTRGCTGQEYTVHGVVWQARNILYTGCTG